MKLLRSILTRILHGGPCGVPCVTCGRPTTYYTRFCQMHVDEIRQAHSDALALEAGVSTNTTEANETGGTA